MSPAPETWRPDVRFRKKRAPVAITAMSILLVAAFVAFSAFQAPRRAFELTLAKAPAHLLVPVRGVRGEALDGAPHGGSEPRAIDIFCARGAEVLAPVAGLVISVGGHSARLLGPGGELHRFVNLVPRAGLAPGQDVGAGEAIGTVGDPTADERGSTPHLHYAVNGLLGRAIECRPRLGAPAF